ncbi:MAG: NAD(P)H dehydrogenase [Denitrovibrio sp.]|nr:MAG: NAD(P)H dehydrogenase [Denitrovibrio sp.]
MKNVLVVLGHSNFENSLSNKTIIDNIKDNPNITVRNLDDVSDNYKFNIEAEQAALSAADVIVLQFPFHWYSTPAILKKWFDDVLTFGFAYGPGGDKLAGKQLVISTTTGGPEDAYKADGAKGHTVEQLLAPVVQTGTFCSMVNAGIVSTSGQLFIPDMMGDKDEVTAKAKDHSVRLLKLLETL